MALVEELTRLDPASDRYASRAVDLVLAGARAAGASDVHLQPAPEGLEIAWRVDGVLRPVGRVPARVAPNVVARLKVLADLLTYRTDTPQEGRLRAAPGEPETRVSTFPTLHGERAVVRLFAAADTFRTPDDLGLPDEVRDDLRTLLGETSGLVLIAGPAGSGKTTTLYACLRDLVGASMAPRCILTMEDPIESAIAGAAQAQVNPSAGLTLAVGLRSLLRQDPEVIAVGEIRDAETAEVAFQAALTGHLVLTTFHAGSAAEAVGRLLELGIEPYLLRSGLLGVLCQRLVRRLCPECRSPADDLLGLPVDRAWRAAGCSECGGSGYVGRLPLVEWLITTRGAVGRAILERSDTEVIDVRARAAGMIGRWDRALAAVESGLTSPAEVRRALGLADPWRIAPGSS